jgi:uncharacterized membrane protein
MDKSTVNAGGRLEFIDGMRAYAILMMLQEHVIALTLADGSRDSGSLLYSVWRHIGGATAPAFLFASGLIVAYLLFQDPDVFDRARLKKYLRRGVHLLILGYLLQMNWKTLVSLYSGDGYFWHWAMSTHILHAIGIGIFVVTALAYLTRSFRWLFPVAAIVLMHAAFSLGSIVTLRDELPGVLRIFSSYVLHSHASFPVLTWVGFALAGGALGFLVIELRLHERIWVFPLLIVLGYMIRARTWFILRDTYAVWWTDYSEWLNYSVFTYYRLGEVLMVAGVIGLLTKFVTMPKFIHATAQETLGIYFLHSILVYGSITGIGMNTFWRHSLDVYTSVTLALLLLVLFMVYAVKAPAIRRRLPFMRFLK